MKKCSFEEIISKISEFAVVYKLFNILITITIATASAERSFCKLKLTKTILINRISDDNVNNEELISFKRQAVPTPSEVLNEFRINWSLSTRSL